MRRYSLLVVTLALIFAASASFAIFPGQYGRAGDGTVNVNLKQGWWNGALAWYSCFATNHIWTAQTQNLTLSAKLSSAIGTLAAPTMYVVTNFNQGPVFSTSPIDLAATYTGLWRITYITWNAGVPRIPITDAAALPPGITQTVTSIVLDCPIFAIGPISNPWHKTTSTVPPYIYRIWQGSFLNAYTKQLTIPFWWAYCRNQITRTISVERVVIPDSSNATITALIGANQATNLGLLVVADRSTMFVINWNQIIPPVLKVLANQYPVLDACPTSTSWRNTNLDYSPVDSFVLLNRNLALISPEVLFNNSEFVIAQITAGALAPVAPFLYPPVLATPVVNAPVLPSLPW